MEQKGTFRGAVDRKEDSQIPRLYLKPLIPKGHASSRSLPLELGRVELVRWWLTSCCMNRTNTTKNNPPSFDRSSYCDRCRSVVDNAKYLSKSMIQLDHISNKLVVLGKNSKCLYMNGKSVDTNEKSQSTGKVGISIADGDILSFQSDDTSPPWMKFRICSSSSICMVTPEGKNLRKSQHDDDDNDSSSRRNDNRSRKGGSQSDELSSVAMRQETSVIKRKRLSISKESRADESSSSNMKTKRKLFSTPAKQQHDTLNNNTSTRQKEHTDEVASGIWYHTQEDLSSTNERNTQVNSNEGKDCCSSVQDSSSFLSLPQFPSDNDYASDGVESEEVIVELSPRNGQSAAKQPSTTDDNSGCDPLSMLDDDTVEWKPVSDLTRSEWQELHRPTAAASNVRQAIAGLILEQNATGKIDWLPDLLNGTVIRKNDVVPKEERNSFLS